MNKRNGIYILSVGVVLLGVLLFTISRSPVKTAPAQTVYLRFTIVDAGSGDTLDPTGSGISVRLIEGRKANGSQTIASDQSAFMPSGETPWEVRARVDGPLTVSIEARGYETEHILLDPATDPTTLTNEKPVRVIRLKRAP